MQILKEIYEGRNLVGIYIYIGTHLPAWLGDEWVHSKVVTK
jgi:hypothetical protein